jgi:predicted MFS family arabinose efflux permease
MFGIGRLAKRFGELNLVKTALVCLATSWLLLVASDGIPGILVAMTFGAFGTAFFQTNMQAMMSLRAGPTERGAVLGVYQSSSSAARFVGQASSGTLFGQIGQNAPFVIGAAAMLPAMALAWWAGRRMQAERRPVGDRRD